MRSPVCCVTPSSKSYLRFTYSLFKNKITENIESIDNEDMKQLANSVKVSRQKISGCYCHTDGIFPLAQQIVNVNPISTFCSFEGRDGTGSTVVYMKEMFSNQNKTVIHTIQEAREMHVENPRD